MDEYFIRECRDEDLPAVAVHWKESVRGWPPGFFPTGDFSPEGVRQWLFRRKYLACWLGWLGDEVVGYLSYCRNWKDADSTYVDLFNVHPDHHGRSFGRKLLVKCVDRATEDGVGRLDLGTWSANKKAVPLYKKCGFFWRPRTEVDMYNFLPVVLRTPVVRDFLGDVHWYEAMRPSLEIREDDELIDGCRYHRYTFEKAGRRMEVLVDPRTSGLVGVVNDDLTIRCDVPGETHIAGLRHPARWTFRSGGPKPVSIELKCAGGEGIKYEPEESFKLEGERTIDTEIEVAPDVEAEPVDWQGKALDCRIVVDGEELRFRPGLRAVPPFKLHTRPYPLTAAPGEILEATFNLRSRVPETATLRPELKCTGNVSFAETAYSETLTIPAEDSLGLRMMLKAADESGPGTVEIGGTLEVGDERFGIHPIRAHVGIAPRGQPVEVPDDDPMITAVSNGVIALRAHRKGGITAIDTPEGAGSPLRIFMEEIGEPFSDEFQAYLYKISVENDPHSATLVCRADSRDFPGLKLERRVRMGTGREISIWVRLHNESEKPFAGAVQYIIASGWRGHVVAPLRDCVVQGSRECWLEGNVPLPLDPTEFGEPWIMWESTVHPPARRFATGLIFEGASHLNWAWQAKPVIEQRVEDLAPGASVDLPSVRLLADAKDWLEVQRTALRGAPSRLPTEPRQFIHPESSLFLSDGVAKFRFHLWRKTASEGSAQIRLPDGRKEEISSEKWSMDAPIDVETDAFASTEPGVKLVDYTGKWVTTERSGQLPMIVPARDAKVKIERGREGGYDFFRVDNGCIAYRVAPDFGGSMYWLSERGAPERNLLRTSFPEVSMWTWWNPWFGGATPDFWLGYRFYQSKFVGDVVRMRYGGHDWEGVRVSVTPLREWRSLHIESLLLTRPGVPMVLNLLRLAETAGSSRPCACYLSVFPRPGGDDNQRSKTVVSQGGVAYGVSPSPGGAMIGNGTSAACYDPETGKTIGVVIPRGNAQVFDAGEEGQALELYAPMNTFPGVTVNQMVAFFLADNPDLIAPLSESVLYWDSILSEADPEPQTGVVVAESREQAR